MFGGPNAQLSSFTPEMCRSGCKQNPVHNTVLQCGLTSPILALMAQEPDMAKCIINTNFALQQCMEKCLNVATPTHLSTDIQNKLNPTTSIFHQPNQLPTMDKIHTQLNMIDQLIKNTKLETTKCIQKIDNITGLSSGDSYSDIAMTTPNINHMFTPQIINIYETLIDTQNCNNNTEIKCKSCNCVWIKSYLLQNELYWCQMCSINHIFTPFSVFDFAPFEDMEKLNLFEEKITKQHNDVYNGHKGYWRN